MVVTFVDNTNFMLKRSDYQNKMHRILQQYIKLYQVIGKSVQFDKILFFSWNRQERIDKRQQRI